MIPRGRYEILGHYEAVAIIRCLDCPKTGRYHPYPPVVWEMANDRPVELIDAIDAVDRHEQDFHP